MAKLPYTGRKIFDTLKYLKILIIITKNYHQIELLLDKIIAELWVNRDKMFPMFLD